MVNWTHDVPSLNNDNAIPVLDLKLNKINRNDFYVIQHTFYKKPMARKSLILAGSALSPSAKRAILIEEGMRRLYNTSRELVEDDSIKTTILQEFNFWARYSGHSEKFRLSVTKEILKRYKEKVE